MNPHTASVQMRARSVRADSANGAWVRALSAALLLTLVACREAPPEAAPTVVASVVVEPAASAVFSETVDAYGTVSYPPRQLRIADSAAELVVDQILVSPGQAVAAGEVLMRIHATANSALELRKAQTDLQFAQQARTRALKLFAQQLATNADVDLTRQAADIAQATLANAQSRVGNVTATDIRAEAPTVIASVDVARGAIVPAGTPLLHLADSGRLQVRLGIEPADLARVREAQSVTVTGIYDTSLAVTGVIDKVVSQIDPQSRLAEAIVNLPQTPGLIPGAMVRAQIELARKAGAISVLHSAVLHAGERPYVYVLRNGIAHQVWVGIGQDDGKRTEIQSGLAAGDPVVVAGNYVLEEGMSAVSSQADATSKPAAQ